MKVNIEVFTVEHGDFTARVDLEDESMSLMADLGEIEISVTNGNLRELIKVLKVAQSFIENDSQIVIPEQSGIDE